MTRANEFLNGVRRSRRLHAQFVELPETAAALQQYLDHKTYSNDIGHFIITADNQLAGMINLNEVTRASSQSAQLGYYMFEPFNGHGLMRLALNEVMTLAFSRYGLHRLEANIQPENRASLTLVHGAGFRREGFSPAFMRIHGRWRDHERWAITDQDWSEQQTRLDVRV